MVSILDGLKKKKPHASFVSPRPPKGGIAIAGVSPATPQASSQNNPPASDSSANNGPIEQGRERLLLDFGWRFHLGNADKEANDFDLGGSGQTFAKSGNMVRPARADYDDGSWKSVDLPHDWAIELPFHEDKPLIQHGSKPLGRNYPETSIGWYRKVFELPASDRGRRLRLEFDGVFRNTPPLPTIRKSVSDSRSPKHDHRGVVPEPYLLKSSAVDYGMGKHWQP